MKKIFTLALSMLAATVAGSAFAETQLLYGNISQGANLVTGEAIGAPAGWSMQITGNESKTLTNGGKITVDGESYASIKLSNGAQNTVTLPEGYIANAVTIYAIANADPAENCYWKEVDGVTYTAEQYTYNKTKNQGTEPAVNTFTLAGDKNSFTFTNSGKQPLVLLLVDYTKPTVEPVDPSEGFGSGALAAPAVYPANNTAMIQLNGAITLTFAEEVQVNGKATLNDKEYELVANGNEVYVLYDGLEPSTAYTLTIPAGTIGNATSQCADLVYNYTTRMDNVLFYADFNMFTEGFYNKYGIVTKNTEIFSSTSATDETVEAGGMTFYSGSKGRALVMPNVFNADPSKDYGPETDEDAGATPNAIQFNKGNGLYMEFPEMEGPVDITLFLGNNNAKNAPKVILTDETGNTEEPLATYTLPKAKKIKKFTYTYPYKGSVKFRIYYSNASFDLNDALFVKGEGEGIDKPVYTDEKAPELLYQWPASNYQPYAPVEGTITLVYDEPVVVAGKAEINGVETEVTVNDKTATIAYSGLEKGKTYTAKIPAIADEAGNENPAFEIVFTTEAADVIFYTDYNYFPYSYWDKFHTYPNESSDNDDIIAKNSTDKEVEIGGILYHVGATAGRVVAMGKSNLLGSGEENLGATQRCAQISGGGDDLYLQLPATTGPCEITLWVGNSTAKEFTFDLRDALTDEVLTTFSTQAEKVMYKFNYVYASESEVQFRIYNNGNQFNLHDILVVKADVETGIEAIQASATDAPVVYYNLQGQRVQNPAAGLYIRVQGTDVKKVIL